MDGLKGTGCRAHVRHLADQDPGTWGQQVHDHGEDDGDDDGQPQGKLNQAGMDANTYALKVPRVAADISNPSGGHGHRGGHCENGHDGHGGTGC